MIYIYANIVESYIIYIFPLYNNLINEYDKKDIKIIFNLDKNISKNDIVIPIGIKQQYELYKHIYNKNIYEMLDDKKEFYMYLKSNDKLLKNIKIIPSYDNSYKGENIKKKYIIKHKNGKASSKNEIIDDYIYNIIEKYNENYQIQDIMEIKYIYGVNCVCLDGKINGIYTYKIKGGISKDTYISGTNEMIENYIKYDKISYFVKKIIKNLNYNGFIELEFLIDTNNITHIMECNPRISGSIISNTMYYDNIIYPHINKKKINIPKIHKNCFFNGTLKNTYSHALELIKKI